MVARVRRAFQVSQGSLETLFRWGGRRLHDFAANLFRKLRNRCHQNRLSVEDITKKHLVSFSGHTVYTCAKVVFYCISAILRDSLFCVTACWFSW